MVVVAVVQVLVMIILGIILVLGTIMNVRYYLHGETDYKLQYSSWVL